MYRFKNLILKIRVFYCYMYLDYVYRARKHKNMDKNADSCKEFISNIGMIDVEFNSFFYLFDSTFTEPVGLYEVRTSLEQYYVPSPRCMCT